MHKTPKRKRADIITYEKKEQEQIHKTEIIDNGEANMSDKKTDDLEFNCEIFPGASIEMIKNAVEKLTEKQRSLFLLMFPLDGNIPLKKTAACRYLGIPAGSVTMIVNRTFEKMAEYLDMKPNLENFSKKRTKRIKKDLEVTKKTVEEIEETTVKEQIDNTLTDLDKNNLKKLIKLLDDELQETLVLLKLGFIKNKKYSNQEISKFFNMSEEDTRTIIHYALLRLREFGETFSSSSIRLETLIENKEGKIK